MVDIVTLSSVMIYYGHDVVNYGQIWSPYGQLWLGTVKLSTGLGIGDWSDMVILQYLTGSYSEVWSAFTYGPVMVSHCTLYRQVNYSQISIVETKIGAVCRAILSAASRYSHFSYWGWHSSSWQKQLPLSNLSYLSKKILIDLLGDQRILGK